MEQARKRGVFLELLASSDFQGRAFVSSSSEWRTCGPRLQEHCRAHKDERWLMLDAEDRERAFNDFVEQLKDAETAHKEEKRKKRCDAFRRCWTRKLLRVHRKPTRISSGPPLIVCCVPKVTRGTRTSRRILDGARFWTGATRKSWRWGASRLHVKSRAAAAASGRGATGGMGRRRSRSRDRIAARDDAAAGPVRDRWRRDRRSCALKGALGA